MMGFILTISVTPDLDCYPPSAGAQMQNTLSCVVFVLLTEESCFYFNEFIAFTLRKKITYIYNLNCNLNFNPATTLEKLQKNITALPAERLPLISIETFASFHTQLLSERCLSSLCRVHM